MKKVLTILLVAAMLIQSSVAVMALSVEQDASKDITLSVSPSEIVEDKELDLTADIAMQSVRDKFEAGLAYADDYLDNYLDEYFATKYPAASEQEKTDAKTKAKNAVRQAELKGEFALVLTYPSAIVMPKSLTEATAMDGFNEEAKVIFEETTARTVAAVDGETSALTITIKVKDGLKVSDLETNLEEYLDDMTITAKDLVARDAGNYTFKAELTGSVEYTYSDQETLLDLDAKIDFVQGEGASIEIAVEKKFIRPTGGGYGGYYVPDADEEEKTLDVAVWPFTDVNAGDWYYNAVAYTYKNGVFKGTTDTTFSPNLATTRGMIVTLIARIEKVSDTAITAISFTDVAENEYYATAIDWAAKNKIVLGYGDGTFGPNDLITREQLAAIWYRYQQYKRAVAEGDLDAELTFADAAQISDYAVDAVKFCFKKGILTGKENNILDPAGSATRAEVATVLMRYLNK